MSYALNILWLDDTPSWVNPTKELIERGLAKKKISVRFETKNDADDLMCSIKRDKNKFKKYDIICIDYNLSSGIFRGNDIIEALRGKEIFADFLFYSEKDEGEIIDILQKNISDYKYEGIYSAKRSAFGDKLHYLIEKNLRHYSRIDNIRGSLMDNSSEFDFIMRESIVTCFNKLGKEGQDEILEIFRRLIEGAKRAAEKNFTEVMDKLGKRDIHTAMRKPEQIMNNADKYKILSRVLELRNQPFLFTKELADEYNESIIKNRNRLAHSMINVADCCKFLKISNNWSAHKTECNCENHSDIDKISEATWSKLTESLYNFNEIFRKIREEVLEDST